MNKTKERLPLGYQLLFWYGENLVSVLTLDKSFLTNFHGVSDHGWHIP